MKETLVGLIVTHLAQCRKEACLDPKSLCILLSRHKPHLPTLSLFGFRSNLKGEIYSEMSLAMRLCLVRCFMSP